MAFINHFIAVPNIVLNDEVCSSTDKLILGIINSLSKENDYCFASNQYFSKTLNLSIRTIKRSISNLKKCKYIEVRKINNKRVIFIRPIMELTSDNFGTYDGDKNYINNIYNNKKVRIRPIISKDKDGVDLWNGVRCESTPVENDSFIDFIKEFRK